MDVLANRSMATKHGRFNMKTIDLRNNTDALQHLIPMNCCNLTDAFYKFFGTRMTRDGLSIPMETQLYRMFKS